MPVAPANPLLDLHRSAEAELQSYGEIEIVSTFGEPQAEYAAIRKSCGMIDLPQRGLLEFTGKDRLSFLNNLLSNETWNKQTKTGLPSGRGMYAFLLNSRGRIVVDMNVLELGERTLVELDVRLASMLKTTLEQYLFVEKVAITDRSSQLHQIALHGPGAAEVLQQASGGTSVEALEPLMSVPMRLFDVDTIVWRDDPCGVPGYTIILPVESARTVWMNLLAQFGQSDQIGKRSLRPVGWAAYNATRIEAGRPMLDIDIPAAAPDRPGAKLTAAQSEEAVSATPTAAVAGVLPAETGQMSRAVSLTKCYLGQEIVARMHARGQVAKQLVGIRMESDALPIAGAQVFDEKSDAIGAVTSSTLSPVLSNVAICLAYVKKPYFTEGTVVSIPAEGSMRRGIVSRLPFVAGAGLIKLQHA